MAKSELKGPEPENDAYYDEITIRLQVQGTHHTLPHTGMVPSRILKVAWPTNLNL